MNEWMIEATNWVASYFGPGERVTGNACWKGGLPVPPDGNRRRLGDVFKKLREDGVLMKTRKVVVSEGGHGQLQAVWVRA